MSYADNRKIWEEAYQELLKFGSDGVLQNEILEAKEVFFSKLGRAHEMREELFEVASQSFLEWYLFEYPTRLFTKTPAVVFLSLGLGSTGKNEILERSLFNHWSIYEIIAIKSDRLILKDLLLGHKRVALKELDAPEFRGWKIKEGQIFQARLFPLAGAAESKEEIYFFTHRWLHPDPEDQMLMSVCKKRQPKWSLHKDLLLSSFEAAVRSYGIQSQIKASGSRNWLYQDLQKRYVS
ncbi:MAG: hypothetical protein J0L93_07655 [Deltaproteobacteria bacterium]|nr:hypothetical protein [Deltaproteobacteria bacterium]